jgi:hypothetical protein
MTNGLIRLAYYSRNLVIGSPETLKSEIASILAASRRNNATVGVTGALMFNSGCFAQVLEGPGAAVEAVFERIQQDERHGDVLLLAFEPTEARMFDGWSMGLVGASIDDAARYGSIVRESGYDPSRMTGDALFETMHRLALEEESSDT